MTRKKKYLFDEKDVGSFITYLGGRTQFLADVMRRLGKDILAGELEDEELKIEDILEAEDDAMEILNKNTAPELYWGMHPDEPGTLILQTGKWWEGAE